MQNDVSSKTSRFRRPLAHAATVQRVILAPNLAKQVEELAVAAYTAGVRQGREEEAAKRKK